LEIFEYADFVIPAAGEVLTCVQSERNEMK